MRRVFCDYCGTEIAPNPAFHVSMEVTRSGKPPLFFDFDKPACVRAKITDATT